jgi:biopolymer transport protein ExbB
MISMNTMTGQVVELWNQAIVIWLAGGWCMPAIAMAALVMFGLGFNVYMKLGQTGFLSVSEKTWRRWIDHPDQRKGPIGDMLNFVTGGKTLKDMATFFEELRTTQLAPFERDLRVMKICVTVSPLLGLLGTVTGMLATFTALAGGSGGEKTMALVAKGISEALITTETGLVVALPGIFFLYQLVRKYERYKAFLAHLETACTQKLYKTLRQQAAA